MNIAKQTKADKIRDYVVSSDKPICSTDVVNALGVSKQMVHHALKAVDLTWAYIVIDSKRKRILFPLSWGDEQIISWAESYHDYGAKRISYQWGLM